MPGCNERSVAVAAGSRTNAANSRVEDEFAEVPQRILMDDVRVYKFTFHFADGSVKTFNEELAFWGSPVRAIQELTKSAGYYGNRGNIVKKVEMEEIE